MRAVKVMSGAALDITYPSVDAAECPFDQFALLRSEAPVYAVPGTSDFLLTRWEDVAAAARDTSTFSSVHSRTSANAYSELGGARETTSLIETDPPEHKAKRDLFFSLVKPGRLREREPVIEGIVDEVIDGFIDRGSFELVGDFAQPFPARVIVGMLGLDPSDVGWLQPWALTDSAGSSYLPADEQAAQARVAARAGDAILAAVTDRFERPRDDELSGVVAAHVEANGSFDEVFMRDNTATFIRGGVITTAHMISMAMLLLLRHPSEMARVRAEPERIPAMLEEALRVQSPVQWVPRRVTRDVVVGGVSIPAGSRVLLMWGSANRDESEFDSPCAFDPSRERLSRSMAFGLGPHFCLGAPIARLEGRIAFERLLSRMSDIRLGEGNDFTHIPSPAFRGLNRLHLEFDAA